MRNKKSSEDFSRGLDVRFNYFIIIINYINSNILIDHNEILLNIRDLKLFLNMSHDPYY